MRRQIEAQSIKTGRYAVRCKLSLVVFMQPAACVGDMRGDERRVRRDRLLLDQLVSNGEEFGQAEVSCIDISDRSHSALENDCIDPSFRKEIPALFAPPACIGGIQNRTAMLILDQMIEALLVGNMVRLNGSD